MTSWADDGFVRIDGFVPEAVGREILDDVVGLVRRSASGEDVDGALVLPESNLAGTPGAPEERASKVFRVHRRPASVAFLARPEVVDVVTHRLGPDVDCFLSQLIFKNPGAWGQPWHQDSYYFPFNPARPVIGLWLAITEATLANGCLHVLPGSHREPIHEHVPDRRPAANLGYVEIVDHDGLDDAVPVTMLPGDLLVFDSHLMHRSTDNVSDGLRAAMVYHVAPAGTVERPGAPPSPVNDWVPIVRGGAPVSGDGRPGTPT